MSLPATAWFIYRGERRNLLRAPEREEFEAYDLYCPLCGRGSYLIHKPGINHTLSVAEDGALTASPSLRCPNERKACPWHVMVNGGQAVDC